MVTARAHYVEATQLAYPYGKLDVAGPFEDSADAFDEARRLRPLYPDANLDVHPVAGRQLKRRVPRGSHDLRTVESRRRAADDIAGRVRALGLDCVIEDWDGEPDVDCATPTVRCNIWLAYHEAAPMPIISWVAADGFAFRDAGRKRTDMPQTWSELHERLEIGLLGSIDGSVFE